MNKAKCQNTEFKVGDTVRIEYIIKEKGKERTQPFQGIVLGITQKTFTVRKTAVDRIGTERIFPLNSPWIASLTVANKPKKRIKRAKLYYLRELEGKKAKI